MMPRSNASRHTLRMLEVPAFLGDFIDRAPERPALAKKVRRQRGGVNRGQQDVARPYVWDAKKAHARAEQGE